LYGSASNMSTFPLCMMGRLSSSSPLYKSPSQPSFANPSPSLPSWRRWFCPSSRSCTRATAAAPTLSCSASLRVLAVRPPVAKIAGVLVPVRYSDKQASAFLLLCTIAMTFRTSPSNASSRRQALRPRVPFQRPRLRRSRVFTSVPAKISAPEAPSFPSR
jgi:hypothetical protein